MEKNGSQEFYSRTGMNNCLEKETAFCISECPFHFDVPEFINKIERGSFTTASRDFKNAVGFPQIALALCDERCRIVCPRKDKDVPLQLKSLEKAALRYAKDTDPNEYNLPRKDKTVVIIGAGICGMACALRLCEKKYQVEIYEKTDRIGGHLWDIMDSSVFLGDFEKQFIFERYQLHLNTEITSIDSIPSAYDAVFFASGADGIKAEGNGIFTGGSLLEKNSLDSLSDGLSSAKRIEAFIKTGVMGQPVRQYCTKMPFPDMEEVIPCMPKMQSSDGFSDEEAKLEAQRCLRCKCDSCRRHCDMLSYYKKSPLKAMEEVRATTEVNGVLSKNITVATKMIASCDQCGLCAEVCPEEIDLKTAILEARRSLHKKETLPWVFNDFFLRDMKSANSETAVTINRCLSATPKYIFFPGCQLGASDPQYVINSYRLLLEYFPDTVLISRCCGAPAVWSGDERLQYQVFDEFKSYWRNLGRPAVIFACPTCKKMFDDYLPEIEGEFLYTMLADMNSDVNTKYSGSASVFDPCNARNDSKVQSAVRRLSEKAGYRLMPLKNERNKAKCCGFGGNSRIVNPQKSADTANKIIGQGADMYITYCTNCRDIFAEHGKKAIHVLDILFGLNNSNRPAPTLTQRKRNRELLKAELLKEFYGSENSISNKSLPNVVINDALKQKLSTGYILEDDILDVISYCEDSGNKILDEEKNTFCGYKEIGYMTYWVEYKYIKDGIELINAYSHRMSIRGQEYG